MSILHELIPQLKFCIDDQFQKKLEGQHFDIRTTVEGWAILSIDGKEVCAWRAPTVNIAPSPTENATITTFTWTFKEKHP